jgi:hypothetical protein
MANQTSALVEQRVVAFALGHPGFGPARIAAELARPKWGEISLSTNGVWRVLGRHGLSTRAKRYGLVAGYAAPPEPQRPQPPPQRHLDVDHPGELALAGLLLHRRAVGHQGDGVSGHRHRRGLGVCLGHPAGDQAQPLGHLDQRPGPAGRRRPGRPVAGRWSGS